MACMVRFADRSGTIRDDHGNTALYGLVRMAMGGKYTSSQLANVGYLPWCNPNYVYGYYATSTQTFCR